MTFFFLLNQQLVDILVINETKLDEKDDISQLEHPSYSILRRDRLINKGGGVMTYVKKNLNFVNSSLSSR